MKKTIILLSLILTTTGHAQSLHLLAGGTDVTNTIVSVPVTKNEDAGAGFSIHNESAAPISYWVSRTILNPKALNACTTLGCSVNICCFAPNSLNFWTPDTSLVPAFHIGANETFPSDNNNKYGLFAFYINCTDECQDVSALYKIYNTAVTTTDTARVTINYKCTVAAAINEIKKPSGTLSPAYPNPAHANFVIPYERVSGKSELVIYDLIGNKVKEVVLEQKKGVVSFDASEFTSGIYFYSLWLNDQRIATKKLIID